ncbi:MAG: glycerophosphodiester phosphodiesterase family protein [Acidobacteriota bacterium]
MKNLTRHNPIKIRPLTVAIGTLLFMTIVTTGANGAFSLQSRAGKPKRPESEARMKVKERTRPGKILVAHRGASGDAPEHTLEAYRLAIKQGADYVEQDLQITRDGVLVCLHDSTLERTTNVEEVFPDRFKIVDGQRHWYVADFTLAELRRLDAGSWFDSRFAGARIPTWQEAIDLVRGQAGLFPETKGPEEYKERGLDMERLVLETLRRNGLSRPGADPRTPVIIQSFSAAGLRKLRRELGCRLPLVLLVGRDAAEEWLTPEGLRKVSDFANGIGPEKRLIQANPSIVDQAHRLGLTVTPYTFRSSTSSPYPDVRSEMEHYLYQLKVDSLFTDNPDQFPRAPSPTRQESPGNGG